MSGGAPAPARPSNLNIANVVTMARIVMVPVVAVLLLHDQGRGVTWRLWALGVFVLAMVSDHVDGELARRLGLITDLGKIADPIADKLLLGTVLVIFSTFGQVWWWVTALILVREVGVTLLRFWVIRYGVIAASSGGKLKTLLQTGALGLYLVPFELWGPSWWATTGEVAAAVVLGAATVVTVVTGADYVVRAIALRRGAHA